MKSAEKFATCFHPTCRDKRHFYNQLCALAYLNYQPIRYTSYVMYTKNAFYYTLTGSISVLTFSKDYITC